MYWGKSGYRFTKEHCNEKNPAIGLQRNLVLRKIKLKVYKGILYWGKSGYRFTKEHCIEENQAKGLLRNIVFRKIGEKLKTFPKMHRSLDIIEMYVNYVHVHYICILCSWFRNVAKTWYTISAYVVHNITVFYTQKMEKEKTFEKKNRKVKPQAISIQEKTKFCQTRKKRFEIWKICIFEKPLKNGCNNSCVAF